MRCFCRIPSPMWRKAAPDLLAPLAALVGGRAGPGLYDFAARLGAPSSLAALGVGADDLDPMAELATANPYWVPAGD